MTDNIKKNQLMWTKQEKTVDQEKEKSKCSCSDVISTTTPIFPIIPILKTGMP